MIFIILLIAFLARLIHINQSFWLDEATNVIASTKGLSDILFHLKLDFHPPLYYYLLHFWMSLFGQSEIAIRIPSLIFGLATIYFTYLIGREVYSKNVGLLSSLFIALSQFHIYYSQEARMYSLAAFGSTLSIWVLLRLIKKPSMGNTIFYSLSILIAIYADYFSFFVIFAQFIVVILKNRKKIQKWTKLYTIGVLIAFVFYIPWIPRFVEQLGFGKEAVITSSQWIQAIGGVSLKSLPLFFAKFSTGNFSFQNKEIYLAFIIVPTLISVWLLSRPLVKRKIDLVILWFVIPLLLAFLISLKVPIFAPFRLLVILPAFWLVISNSVLSLKPSLKIMIIAIIVFGQLMGVGLYIFNSDFQREDWKGLVKYIDSHSSGVKSITIFENKAQYSPYLYYNEKVEPGGPQSWQAGSYDKIWLMRYLQPLFDPQDNVKKSIENAGYAKFDQKSFRGVEVWGYKK